MGNENGTWVMHGLPADAPGCIHTWEELVAYIDKVGFLPLFKNDVPGFSAEEHTESGYWWSGNREKDPWEWREIIAESGRAAYGKFFDKKAGFISREWLPYFVNHRRDGYDFDALWDDEKASVRQKKIMDLFGADTELFSSEVKELSGFDREGEKNFEGIVTALQMETYLCVRYFRQRKNKKGMPYGWPVAVYSRPEHIWGRDHAVSAYGEPPAASFDRIKEQMRKLYPTVTDRQLSRL